MRSTLTSLSIKLRHLYKKKAIKVLTGSIIVLVFLYILPSVAFQVGNLFFGKVKPLYNVRLAHYAFQIATHPILQKLPPRYAHYQLSRTYFIRGENMEALDEVKRELEIYPDDTNAYYVLGLVYGFMGRSHEGIDAFSQYIETHPRTWAGRNDKAWLQFRIGDIDGALATIEPVVKQFPYTPWVQNTYCSLLINTSRYAEAKKVCNHAKTLIDKMTEKDWGHAYPGNDPRIYGEGLEAMKGSINENLKILEKR
jgi:tetratricopeptide (TPR) repeat protein